MYKNVFVTNITDIDVMEENKVTTTVTNEFGEQVEKQIDVPATNEIKVSFNMECILNDWK